MKEIKISDFEMKIYKFLQIIPQGKVVSYGQIASAIGSPGASRAVGNALHKNPWPDVYPCYKVVNREGRLAEHFGLGIEEQKRRLENDGIIVKNFAVGKEYFWK